MLKVLSTIRLFRHTPFSFYRKRIKTFVSTLTLSQRERFWMYVFYTETISVFDRFSVDAEAKLIVTYAFTKENEIVTTGPKTDPLKTKTGFCVQTIVKTHLMLKWPQLF